MKIPVMMSYMPAQVRNAYITSVYLELYYEL